MAQDNITVTIEGANFTTPVRPYESGSEGYNLSNRIYLPDGAYQVTMNVIRVDSQYEPEATERAARAKAIKGAKEAARAEKSKRKK